VEQRTYHNYAVSELRTCAVDLLISHLMLRCGTKLY